MERGRNAERNEGRLNFGMTHVEREFPAKCVTLITRSSASDDRDITHDIMHNIN
jgi:hypothetical protein